MQRGEQEDQRLNRNSRCYDGDYIHLTEMFFSSFTTSAVITFN